MVAPSSETNPSQAVLTVIDPSGNRSRVPISVTPFRIGRQAGNQLLIRDSRVSRQHAQIEMEGGDFVVVNAQSRHGVYVNGQRVERHVLQNSDRIEFGIPDSYQLLFAFESSAVSRVLERFPLPEAQVPSAPGAANLAKLRAVLEVARVLQTSLPPEEVLGAVVDAALTVTGGERGFLLLRSEEGLVMKVARDRNGTPLAEGDLRVPRQLITKALEQRRELLSMSFDPLSAESPGRTVADLELRSVVCVPLVKIRMGSAQETSMLSAASDTVGLLYMDSRLGAADLSAGNRELLQTLALEASTVLENARLLDEERAKLKIEEELNFARRIQQSLLPRTLPDSGWFRCCGSSVASHQVGGDYFDVIPVDESAWAVVVADVSGKGVSSALLASLLQGAFLASTGTGGSIEKVLGRINELLGSRTGGEKYATIFYGIIGRDGVFQYANAGHCPPLVISAGRLNELRATAIPVGLMEEVEFPSRHIVLQPGDKVVIYSDGVSEAQNRAGDFYGLDRLYAALTSTADACCSEVLDAIRKSVSEFTQGAEQGDDITVLVLGYAGEPPASSY